VVGCDEVHEFGMLLDVVADERAVGEDGQPALAGGIEDTRDQGAADPATADAGVHLGVRKGHRGAVDVVAGQPDDAVAELDLEASLLRDVHHLRVHALCPSVPPAPLPGLDVYPER